MAKQYPKLGNILRRLLYEKQMKSIDLAREVKVPQPTIHRLVTGKSVRPYQSSLTPIARYFGITIDQLVGEEPLAEEFASHDLSGKSQQLRRVPLIKWEEIENFITTNQAPTEEPYIIMDRAKLSLRAFATEMKETSMEPVFRRGAQLVFDPELQPKDRDFVLVKLNELKTPIFRLLLVDGNDQYLKPLNSDLSNFKTRLLEDSHTILAVLVESRTSFQDS